MALGVGGDVVARLKAIVEVDTSGLSKGLKEAADETQRSGSKWSTALKTAGTGAALAVTAVATAVGVSLKAASDYQKVNAQLKVSLRDAGLSWKQYGGSLDDTIKRQTELSGFTEDDLTAGYAKLVTTTKSVTESHKLMGDAMDLARARGIPLQNAVTLVSKVYDGSTTALQRYGIQLGKNATSEQALTAIHQKFGGASAAYAKTADGEWARFQATLGIVETQVGLKLLPVLQALLAWLLKMAQSKQTQKWLAEIGAAIEQTIKTVRPMLPQFEQVFHGIEKVVQTVMPIVKTVVETQLKVMRDFVQLALDLLTGKWGDAWGDVKRLTFDSLHGVISILSQLLPLAEKGASRIGSAIYHGITGLLSDLGGAISGLVRSAIDDMIGEVNRGLNVIHDHWPDVPGAPGPPFGHNPIPMLAGGGFVPGAYNGGRDSVLTLLSPGELVLNRRQQGTLAGLLGINGNGATGGTPTIHQTLVFQPATPVGVAMKTARFQAQSVFS